MIEYGKRVVDGWMTLDEFERVPDDLWRRELVRGRVVKEPPAGGEHGRLTINLGAILARFVQQHGLGVVCGAETGFVLREDPPTVRAPDAAFIAADRVPPGGAPIGYWRLAPDLAVEVLSPSNTRRDVAEKVADYLDAGAKMVWVVDPRGRTVTVHRPSGNPLELARSDTLTGGRVLPGLRVPVARIFE